MKQIQMLREKEILAWLKSEGAIDVLHEFARNKTPIATILRSGIVGAMGESLFQTMAQERGHRVDSVAESQRQYDFVVDGRVKVQCKSCNNKDRKADIRSRYPTEATGRKYRYPSTAFDVLFLQMLGGIFIIPTNAIVDPENRSVMRQRLKPEIYEPYRDRWTVLKDVP